ncbi:MAG: 2-amino-4-hydroxy-6-hydroxymethyldihydropteridine diphosphokinase [Acidobacteriota bacterium]
MTAGPAIPSLPDPLPGDPKGHRAVLAFGLGSNLGDRRGHLRWAIERLQASFGPLEVAPVYETRPLSAIPQPDFLNTVAVAPLGGTVDGLYPRQIVAELKALERAAGRRRGPRHGPRPLDLDLLLLGDATVDLPELAESPDPGHWRGAVTVPHRELRRRRFVLAPLVDLRPALALPPDGKSAAELLATLPPQGVRRLD